MLGRDACPGGGEFTLLFHYSRRRSFFFKEGFAFYLFFYGFPEYFGRITRASMNRITQHRTRPVCLGVGVNGAVASRPNTPWERVFSPRWKTSSRPVCTHLSEQRLLSFFLGLSRISCLPTTGVRARQDRGFYLRPPIPPVAVSFFLHFLASYLVCFKRATISCSLPEKLCIN